MENEAQPNPIFIFDNVACEKQDNIIAFFAMGQHEEVNYFY